MDIFFERLKIFFVVSDILKILDISLFWLT